MKLQVKPSEISGTIIAPPSKSCTHRAIVLASLAKGTSKIEKALICKDTTATIQAMEAFGLQPTLRQSLLYRTATTWKKARKPEQNTTSACSS